MTETEPGMAYEDVEISMVRDDIDNVPIINLPTGYSFRNYQPGDEVTWTEIQRASDPFNVIDDALFEREYGSAANQLPGPHVVCDDRRGRGHRHHQQLVGTWTRMGRRPWAYSLGRCPA